MGRMSREGEPGGAAEPTNPASLGSRRKRRGVSRHTGPQETHGATVCSRPSCPMGSTSGALQPRQSRPGAPPVWRARPGLSTRRSAGEALGEPKGGRVGGWVAERLLAHTADLGALLRVWRETSAPGLSS